MKAILFLTALTLIGIQGYSQLDLSRSEIIAKHGSKYIIVHVNQVEGICYTKYKTLPNDKEAIEETTYFFLPNDICYWATITIHKDMINYFIQNYDNKYVKVGENKWKDYKTNTITKIESLDDGYFLQSCYRDESANSTFTPPSDAIEVEKANGDIKTNNSNTIPLKKKGGVYEVPVVINGSLKLNFILDSGASDVSISPDVALTLTRTGTVSDADFIGTDTYRFADGTTAKSTTFNIREIKIGNRTITNIKASISNSINAPLLLGQSLLNRLGKVTIDYTNGNIIIQN